MKPPSVAIGFASLVLAAFTKADNVIVNGDFETGDFTGWTVTDTETDKSYTIESTNPLSGNHSARQFRRSGSRNIGQTFDPITDSATVSFLFSADYPNPTGGDRVLHLFLEGTTGRINIRVAVATGDLQVADRVGSTFSWQSTGINGLALDGTEHAVSISLNSFGAEASYDISVGEATASGLTVFDNGAPSDLRTLRFESNSNAQGGFTLIDNVSVVFPPPASGLAVTIRPTPDTPGSYDFTWNSQPGKIYDLVSSTDLSTSPSTWPVWDGQSDIAADPPTNTLVAIPGGGDPKRFFSIIEKIAP